MNNIIIIIYYLIQYIILSEANVIGEYLIDGEDDPSYLFHKFDNIQEEVFPRDIRIVISLSKISGTLLYSMDRHMNQIIFSLQSGVSPKLIVEFNKRKSFVSFKELCGCEQCLYEVFDIHIQIESVISLRCNGGTSIDITYSRSLLLNADYPIPYSRGVLNTHSTNEAHMWLVNVPKGRSVTKDSDQLSGCIFDVSYNDEPIEFTEISNNIERKCSKVCGKTICNGGVCHETYNVLPICECTQTFLNGRFCKSDNTQKNGRSIYESFIFDMFKISWMTSAKQIFRLETKFLRIRLSHVGGILYFHYSFVSTETLKETLSSKYFPSRKYILIIHLHGTAINIKFYDNGVWRDSIILTNHKIKTQMLTSLTIETDDGYFDPQIRNAMDYTWQKVPLAYVIGKRADFHSSPQTQTQNKPAPPISSNFHSSPRSERQNFPKETSYIHIIILLFGCIGMSAIFWIISKLFGLLDRIRGRKVLLFACIGMSAIFWIISKLFGLLDRIRGRKDKPAPPIVSRRETEHLIYPGKFTEVYLCLDTSKGRLYAKKQLKLRQDNANDQTMVRKCLENEIKIYKMLPKHPQIVEYYGDIHDHNGIHIHMEYMPRGSLGLHLALHGPLPLKIIARYTKQILKGLQLLHKHNIIHRDIKGGNILMANEDNVKLCDFGISRYSPIIDLHFCASFFKYTICGTAYWMAPEVIRGELYSFEADIWSLGATVVEMLTGTHPYPYYKESDAMYLIGTTSILQYHQPKPVSPILELFLSQMLKANQSERASAEELLISPFIYNIAG